VVREDCRRLRTPVYARKIATRSLKGGAWTALETGWKVTPYEGGEIHVQLNNSEGVVVSLNSSTGK
jgi:hypothetical protein